MLDTPSGSGYHCPDDEGRTTRAHDPHGCTMLTTIGRRRSVKLEGKVALVTGGGGAMGGAQCRLFAEEGAAVCVTDLFLEKAQAVADDIEKAGGQGHRRPPGGPAGRRVGRGRRPRPRPSSGRSRSSATTPAPTSASASTTRRRSSSASWSTRCSSARSWASRPSCRRCARPGRRHHQPRLALLDSARGRAARLRGRQDRADRPDALGGGLLRARTTSAASWSRPGHVDTPFIRGNNPYSPNDTSTSIDNPENYERRRRATPLGRLQTAEDIAKTMLFVVSDDAAMITGSMITVDGGAAL